MIEPGLATIIIIGFVLIFGILIPILDVKLKKFVSLRWCVVVVVLALLIGAVIDFEVLDNEARKIVLIGGLVIGGGYVLLRTIEKVLSNGWLRGATIQAQKGDISLTVTSEKESKENDDTDK